MTLRMINVVTHDLSGAQILHSLLRYFQQSRAEPVTLMTRRGTGEDTIQKVRTALSRNRKAMSGTDAPITYFGFSTDGPFRFKMNGIDYDSYAIQFHVTGLQKMKNLSLSMKDISL